MICSDCTGAKRAMTKTGVDAIPNLATDAPDNRDGYRLNRDIRAAQVRLIDPEGAMLGVMSSLDARRQAEEFGLDLVEISPNAEPPVCKIMDFGKFKYAEQKKANEAKKRQKVVEIKEIKVRPNIDDNDYQIKLRSMRSFIQDGHKVKVSLRFKGREITHQELGVRVLDRIRLDLEPITKVEQPARMDMRQLVMVLASR
jgi:translation initiation factor IF-3